MSEKILKAASEGAARKKRFVVVVDNNQRDATYTSVLLQNLGYNTTVARSGEEALEIMSITAPALIVTELVLPGMNGLDLFDRITADPLQHAAPVIIATRFTDLESEDQCRRSGCAGCLNKPLQPAELYRAVQQSIEPTPRQNIRVPVLLNASLGENSSGKELVTMLSDSGLFLRTYDPPATGSKHTLTFLLGDRIIRADIVVLYTNRFEEHPSKEPGMGVKFLNLTPVDKDLIQSYIRDQVHPGILPQGAG